MQTPTPTRSSKTCQERMICETAAGSEVILALKSTALGSDGDGTAERKSSFALPSALPVTFAEIFT